MGAVPLFVHGLQKTMTSTMVGFLNSYPDVFVLYETGMGTLPVSKYGEALLKFDPDIRRLFHSHEDIGAPYRQLGALLHAKRPESKYKYVGDKFISFDPALSQPSSEHKTIYMIRDVRTWLCKEQTVSYYRTDIDIVAPAVSLLKYLIKASAYSNSIIVRMEDFLKDNANEVARIENFLGICSNSDQPWWQTIGKYPDDDPKSSQQWSWGHFSSTVKPGSLDTKVTAKPHAFWDDYIPVFNRYFETSRANPIDQDQVQTDLELANGLMKYSQLPLEDAFSNIETRMFTRKDLGSRFSLSRIKYSLARSRAKRR